MTDLRARLVAYNPDGTRSRVLPAPFEWTAGLPLNDLPTLACKYTKLAPGGDTLAGQVEVGLEVSTNQGLNWAEPLGARFLATGESGDDADTAETLSPVCKGVAYHLAKAVIHPHPTPNADNTTENGERIFAGASPGGILRTLIDEAHGRGVITPLTTNATQVYDSAGQTWTETINLNLPIGQDLMTVLRSLSDQGLCDWTTEGRNLRLYKPDTVLGRDKTGTILRTGVDTTEASRQLTVDDAANRILLLGDDGVTKTITNSSAPTMFGAVWETSDSMAGVPDEGTQEALGQALLAKRDGARVQRSRQLALPKLRATPFEDFRTGDTITADGATGDLESQRIMQVTLSRTAAGLGLAVTLNDRFVIADLRRDRQINQIKGSSGTSGGNGLPPGSTGPDTRTPKQVTGLAASSASYIDPSGQARAQITLNWAQVTAATDDVAQVIAAYYVERRPVGGEWSKVAEVLDPTTVWMDSPYEPGTQWQFRVQALSAGWVLGAFSNPVTVTAAVDTTPPPTPDPNGVDITSRMGTITVTWDGTFIGGASRPADFSHIRIYTLGSGPAVNARIDGGAGTVTITGLPYETSVFLYLVAVDTSGNESGATGKMVTMKPLVDTDIIGEIIAGANIIDGTINAADKIIANTITGDLIQANAINTDKLTANAIDGMVITGAVLRTATSGARIQLDSTNGLRGFNASSVLKTQITTDGTLTAADATITGLFRTALSGSARVEVGPDPDAGFVGRVAQVSGSGVVGAHLSLGPYLMALAGGRNASSGTSAYIYGNAFTGGRGSVNIMGGSSTAHEDSVTLTGSTYVGSDEGRITIRGTGNGGGSIELLAAGVKIVGLVDFNTTATKTSAKQSLGVPHAEAAGSVTIPAVNAGALVNVAVTFPVGRFNVAPLVATVSNHYRLTTCFNTGTQTTGFNLVVFNNTSVNVAAGQIAHWQAKQMTPTTAAG
ncbi:hypothetical protein SAMN06309944_0257 [Micrococcales bacterium KH10]|nr:hypothetical protein SAMN06309944_0257 [Micrococcales bacterium KH10]